MNATHPTAAEQLVAHLEWRGVRHVFGLCGHTNIAVLAAMAASTIEFVNVRHEQVAAHAADGYARVTGRASVVLSHLSPGLTNAATGVGADRDGASADSAARTASAKAPSRSTPQYLS